jgi:tetratricopeptide (TPR) repeat protein
MRNLELYKYNPGQCYPEDLEATFVAREAILKEILATLRERADAAVNQHMLIIGPRGIGKTNLLFLLKYRAQNDDTLARAYIPIQTAEEEYSIVSLRDFFSKILDLVLETEMDDTLQAAAEAASSADDDEQATEMTIEALEKYCRRVDRKLLLLLDNFDLILDPKVMDEAQTGRLRDVLMNWSFLTLIATAPTHFKEVAGYDRPFYQFFRPIELKDLSLEEMAELLKKQAKLEKNQILLDCFEELAPRIKAIYHLTGGNPRLVLMLYQLYTRTELPEVRASVQKLLDDLTPYYKHRMETLSPQQRKTLDTFARLGRPATPTELAKETRLPVNQINSILTRLRELGFVSKSEQKRRKSTYYMVSERVFRIWHQMRFSTQGRRKLEFFIEFLRIWYSEKEWLEESRRLLGEYQSMAAEKRFSESGRFVDHLDYLVAAAPKAELGYLVADATIRACIEAHDFEGAERVIKEGIDGYSRERNDERLAECWYLMAYLQNERGRTEDEIAALKKALQYRPEFPLTLGALGAGLGDLAGTKVGEERDRLYQEAFDKYQKALEIKPDKHEALYNWGNSLRALADTKVGEERDRLYQEAFDKYQKALEIKPDFHEALNNWGNSLGALAGTKHGPEQERLFEEAMGKILAAIRAASSQGDREGLSSYSAHFIHIALTGCQFAVQADNRGQARALFETVLQKLPLAREDLATKELVSFFGNVLREKTASICGDMFALMEEQKLDQAVGVLEPFRIAITYWQAEKKDREEVLDRLNPEVREIVEAIIQGKEKS